MIVLRSPAAILAVLGSLSTFFTMLVWCTDNHGPTTTDSPESVDNHVLARPIPLTPKFFSHYANMTEKDKKEYDQQRYDDALKASWKIKALRMAARPRSDEESGDDCDGFTCPFRNSCGQAPLNKLTPTKKRLGPYMINGARQDYGEWPSYVRLSVHWSGVVTSCGGVLISNRHVLTAAHCMFDPHKGIKEVKKQDIVLIFGDDIIALKDKHEVHAGVSNICISSQFMARKMTSSGYRKAALEKQMTRKRTTSSERPHLSDSREIKSNSTGIFVKDDDDTIFDFAVLTINTAMHLNKYRQPACLPRGNFTKKLEADKKDPICYLVGSGVVSFYGNIAIMAKTVEKMLMKKSSCSAYGFGHRDLSRICYTKADGVGDSCAGDSGGPILCLDPQTKRWTSVALVSYGSTNCDGEDPVGWVGVYSRVESLLPIIENECGI